MPWHPPGYNVQQREELWVQSLTSSHATFCGCGDPSSHLRRILSRLNNSGRQPPEARNSIRALPALPAPQEPEQPPPRPGTGTEEGPGAEGGDRGGAYGEEDLEDLFAAAEEDDM